MKAEKITDIFLKCATALLLAVALLLTFTVSDYYIFNRIGQFNAVFIIAQWIKKAGLILLPLAVFFKRKSCADAAKYLLPIFVIISGFTYGDFFDATTISESSSPAELVYAHINAIFTKDANVALFIASNTLYIVICALFFIRDGFKVKAKSFYVLPFAVIGSTPLNIFENFFDIQNFDRNDFLWFKNFTIWHLLAILILVGFTVGAYFFLRKKSRETQNAYLAATAIVLLLQYHSKDSMVMGDGYNVYRTLFACIPLFICNIGVYIASASVFFKKKILYAIAFFIHSAGALTVFFYFGRDDMSNYGIFCSYSILYFCLTHCLLFALSVLPAALGHYSFKIKDCIIPLVYYFAVIITASVASALVTSASMQFGYDGYILEESEWLYPNYAFTQINPLPFNVPIWKLTIWRYDLNILYVLGLYAVYVGIFFLFNGAYYAFMAIRKKIVNPAASKIYGIAQIPEAEVTETEAAITDDTDDN